MTGLTEHQQKDLYWALLRGIGRECQNRMCLADRSDADHDWGPWRRYAIEHDFVTPMVSSGLVQDVVVRVRAERHCQNCGKEQHA